MEYRRLGRSGVLVSPLCLGTMNFGGATTESDSFEIMQKAVDGGINFFDTANVYYNGEGERIIGKFLKHNGSRDQVVVATKVFGQIGDLPNEGGATLLDAPDRLFFDELVHPGNAVADFHNNNDWMKARVII